MPVISITGPRCPWPCQPQPLRFRRPARQRRGLSCSYPIAAHPSGCFILDGEPYRAGNSRDRAGVAYIPEAVSAIGGKADMVIAL
jgi:hypothetical protein